MVLEGRLLQYSEGSGAILDAIASSYLEDI